MKSTLKSKILNFLDYFEVKPSVKEKLANTLVKLFESELLITSDLAAK